jgi:hypothetical protein
MNRMVSVVEVNIYRIERLMKVNRLWRMAMRWSWRRCINPPWPMRATTGLNWMAQAVGS